MNGCRRRSRVVAGAAVAPTWHTRVESANAQSRHALALGQPECQDRCARSMFRRARSMLRRQFPQLTWEFVTHPGKFTERSDSFPR